MALICRAHIKVSCSFRRRLLCCCVSHGAHIFMSAPVFSSHRGPQVFFSNASFFHQTMQLSSCQGNRISLVSHNISALGPQLQISILLMGTEVKGSPFSVTILEEVDPKNCIVQGAASSTAGDFSSASVATVLSFLFFPLTTLPIELAFLNISLFQTLSQLHSSHSRLPSLRAIDLHLQACRPCSRCTSDLLP